MGNAATTLSPSYSSSSIPLARTTTKTTLATVSKEPSSHIDSQTTEEINPNNNTSNNNQETLVIIKPEKSSNFSLSFSLLPRFNSKKSEVSLDGKISKKISVKPISSRSTNSSTHSNSKLTKANTSVSISATNSVSISVNERSISSHIQQQSSPPHSPPSTSSHHILQDKQMSRGIGDSKNVPNEGIAATSKRRSRSLRDSFVLLTQQSTEAFRNRFSLQGKLTRLSSRRLYRNKIIPVTNSTTNVQDGNDNGNANGSGLNPVLIEEDPQMDYTPPPIIPRPPPVYLGLPQDSPHILAFMDNETLRDEFVEYFLALIDYREKFQENLWKLILTKIANAPTSYEIEFGDYCLYNGSDSKIKIPWLTQLRTRDSASFTRSMMENNSFLKGSVKRDLLLLIVWCLFASNKKLKDGSTKFSIVGVFEEIEDSFKHAVGRRRRSLMRHASSMGFINPSNVSGGNPGASPLRNSIFQSLSNKKESPASKSDYDRFHSLMKLLDNNIENFRRNEELKTYIKNGEWMKITIAELLNESPVALSICKVEEGGAFPIIYANDAFRDTTLFPLDEVIGQTLEILESLQTEKSQVAKIRTALKEGLAVKVILTNQRKDGSLFVNFFSSIPIYDRNNNYKYVIIKLYDCTQSTSCFREIKMAEEVLLLTSLMLRNC